MNKYRISFDGSDVLLETFSFCRGCGALEWSARALKLYFHISLVDDHVTDPEWMTFANVDDAIREAEKAIFEMAFEAIKASKPFDIVSIRICDASGELFAEIVSADVLNGLTRQ